MTPTEIYDLEGRGSTARTFRLVGEFMFHWASLEAALNHGIHKLYSTRGIDGYILTANLNVRDKLHILRTMVANYAPADPSLGAADKTLTAVGDKGDERNRVAHNVFFPHRGGGVEFFLVKAKGKFSIPDTVWSVEDFTNRFAEMNALQESITEIVEKVIAIRVRLKHLSVSGNAFLPPSPNIGLIVLG